MQQLQWSQQDRLDDCRASHETEDCNGTRPTTHTHIITPHTNGAYLLNSLYTALLYQGKKLGCMTVKHVSTCTLDRHNDGVGVVM